MVHPERGEKMGTLDTILQKQLVLLSQLPSDQSVKERQSDSERRLVHAAEEVLWSLLAFVKAARGKKRRVHFDALQNIIDSQRPFYAPDMLPKQRLEGRPLLKAAVEILDTLYYKPLTLGAAYRAILKEKPTSLILSNILEQYQRWKS
jgi:hypothetical protein